MEGVENTVGRIHFGAVALGDARLTERAVQVADQLLAHPHDSFPQKFHSPADLQGFYRLMKHERVTHASLLAPHLAVTLERMKATPGIVLLLQDTTVLDYSGLESIEELGQVGNGHGRGYYCHNGLAVAAATREVFGLAAQVLHRRRRAPRGEKRAVRQKAPDRESRLWKTLSSTPFRSRAAIMASASAVVRHITLSVTTCRPASISSSRPCRLSPGWRPGRSVPPILVSSSTDSRHARRAAVRPMPASGTR